MIRVHFECMNSMPALVLTTTDPDEAAWLRVFGYQVEDGSSRVSANVGDFEPTLITPAYGHPFEEKETRLTLDLLPADE